MNFNRHSALEGRHAFLSASKYHWINYEDDKFDRYFFTQMAAAHGTQMHALAADLIRLRVALPDTEKTINQYVNDAIGYRMEPEVVLAFSDNAFGTADTIGFFKGLLRIHDLKNGMTKTSFNQLMVYAALFCLEYGITPYDIQIELRIYQNDKMEFLIPNQGDILNIMERIKYLDARLEKLKEEMR